MLFNILVTLFAGYACFRIACKLDLKHPWLAAILFLFSPVVFASAFSGLAEPLFACMLSLAVWLLLEDKWIAAALVLSFSPFVRSEGFVMLTVFQLGFLLYRKWGAIAFSLTGTVLYSLIGAFHFGDILWLIHESPYGFGENPYGKGEWHYFLSRNEFVFGIPFFILIMASTLFGLVRGIRKPDKKVFFILVLPYLIFFLLHSILWAAGIQAGGLLRVMAGGMPLIAVLALYALEWFRVMKIKPVYLHVFTVVAALTSMIYPFKQYGMGFKFSYEEKALMQIMPELGKAGKKFYYQHPTVTLLAETDPFDPGQCREIWHLDRDQPSRSMQPGELLVWDSHYAALEGQLPSDKPEKDKDLKLLRTITAGTGKHCFEVRLYQRTLAPAP